MKKTIQVPIVKRKGIELPDMENLSINIPTLKTNKQQIIVRESELKKR